MSKRVNLTINTSLNPEIHKLIYRMNALLKKGECISIYICWVLHKHDDIHFEKTYKYQIDQILKQHYSKDEKVTNEHKLQKYRLRRNHSIYVTLSLHSTGSHVISQRHSLTTLSKIAAPTTLYSCTLIYLFLTAIDTIDHSLIYQHLLIAFRLKHKLHEGRSFLSFVNLTAWTHMAGT